MLRSHTRNGAVRMDKPIGYEVMILELRASFKAYCKLYGRHAAKQAVSQVYTEVFKSEQVSCAENASGGNQV